MIIAVAIIVVGGVARKAAEKLSLTWGKRTKAEAEELGALDGLYNNASMLWLVETLTGPRRIITKRRTEAATEYARAGATYYFFMHGIGTFLKVTSVAGGAIMVKLGAISIGTLSLFLVYSFMLSERMHGIFGISEVFGNAATESCHLLETLESGSKKPPLVLSSDAPILAVKDVCVEYTVLSDQEDENTDQPSRKLRVSLGDVILRPGVALLTGPNGCGKTTLLKVIAGVKEYSQGSVTLAGCEIKKFDIRPHVFYGQQDFDKLAVTIQDLFGEHSNKDLCRRALSYVNYEDAPMSRSLSDLSGGQRRRIFLARLFYAVLTREKETLGVLCLDEPTNDLDRDTVNTLKSSLVELAESDPLLIIALVSHELEMKDIADQIVER